jgi:hypothetical protein
MGVMVLSCFHGALCCSLGSVSCLHSRWRVTDQGGVQKAQSFGAKLHVKEVDSGNMHAISKRFDGPARE